MTIDRFVRQATATAIPEEFDSDGRLERRRRGALRLMYAGLRC